MYQEQSRPLSAGTQQHRIMMGLPCENRPETGSDFPAQTQWAHFRPTRRKATGISLGF